MEYEPEDWICDREQCQYLGPKQWGFIDKLGHFLSSIILVVFVFGTCGSILLIPLFLIGLGLGIVITEGESTAFPVVLGCLFVVAALLIPFIMRVTRVPCPACERGKLYRADSSRGQALVIRRNR